MFGFPKLVAGWFRGHWTPYFVALRSTVLPEVFQPASHAMILPIYRFQHGPPNFPPRFGMADGIQLSQNFLLV